ncbi:MAG TPA: GAF domain-containing protein [Longilinea sp.]|nr:GAF domain-containing protein [Longilinea sp.]
MAKTKKIPSPGLPSTLLRGAKPNSNLFVSFSAFVIGGIGIAALILGFFDHSWQFFVAAGFLSTSAVIINILRHEVLPTREELTIFLVSLIIQINLGMLGFLFVDIGIPLGIYALLLSITVTTAFLHGRLANVEITSGLVFGVGIAMLGLVGLSLKLEVPYIQTITHVTVIVLGVLLAALVLRGVITLNLRIRFTILFLAIALTPLIFLAIIENIYLQDAIQQQKNVALQLAADTVGNQIEEFINSNLESVSTEAALPVFRNFLIIDPTTRDGSPELEALDATITILRIQRVTYTPSFGILDLTGMNVYDTNPLMVGRSESDYDYFSEPVLTGINYVSPVLFSSLNGNGYIYFSAPIFDDSNNIIGVLRVQYDALILQNILNSFTGLTGPRSYPILLDENLLRIGDTITPNLIYKTVAPLTPLLANQMIATHRLPEGIPTEQMATNMLDFATIIQGYLTTPNFTYELHPSSSTHNEIGTIIKLTSRTWYVIYVEEETGLLATLNSQRELSSLIAIIFAGIVGIIGTLVSILISNPIITLTSTAEKVSGGDLEAQAKIGSRDEIGVLATAFNSMTSQLRGLVQGLEGRVQQRTEELEKQNEFLTFRSRQLQTVSDVARSVTTVQDMDSLLNSVVRLMSERFNFYHVGIFLVDPAGQYAVLRASNSEGGQRMLARQHKLKVGQVGIVGYVTGTGQARIATDVGADAVYFSNPDLPLTRSEMALPLKIAGNVIGALDVQSVTSNAFSQEDIDLFTTLADQVSVAINNNELFQETNRALEEAQKLHRQYLQQQWSHVFETRHDQMITYSENGVSTQPAEKIEGIQKVMASGEVYENTKFKDNPAILAVPIKLRGQTIGVIHCQQNPGERSLWKPEEIDSVTTIADQVGLALENARLFDQTLRRADRERHVVEITSKIRATNDPQEMLQIAITELQKVLNASHAQILIQSGSKEIPIEKPVAEPQPENPETEAGDNGSTPAPEE